MSNKDKRGNQQVGLIQEGYADCSTKCCSAQHVSQLNVAVTQDVSEEVSFTILECTDRLEY